jgi:hypothetical protein
LANSQASVKGNWSEIEKQTLIEELQLARESFETFLDSSQVDGMIYCLADKIEINFENMDEMDGNSDDIERMTFNCLEEMGLLTKDEVNESTSQKGNWNDADIERAYENLEYTRNIMGDVVDSSKVDLLFDCVVNKLQFTYESFSAASKDSKNVSGLTYACIDELQLFTNTSESTKGNWSEEDIKTLNQELDFLRNDLLQKYNKETAENVINCIREKFENSFDNYQDINNHPEVYRGILDECYGKVKE